MAQSSSGDIVGTRVKRGTKKYFILGALEGKAKREMLLFEETKWSSSTTLLQELKKVYGKTTSLAQLRVQFFQCRQKEEERVGAFILRLRELFSKWREGEPGGSAQDENTARDQLVLGLNPGPIQHEIQ